MSDRLPSNSEPQGKGYEPPRTKMGWERLYRELREADERIVHYLRETKQLEKENRELREEIARIKANFGVPT